MNTMMVFPLISDEVSWFLNEGMLFPTGPPVGLDKEGSVRSVKTVGEQTRRIINTMQKNVFIFKATHIIEKK